ncbi:MAG TPA: hypothetical protein VKM55_02860 [Candidatus Lokiarchaeia archaeon]|nr:hypothetical protein [Candidatus Lokiarchaeia archaeon]
MNVNRANAILSWTAIFLMTVQVSENTERVVDAIIGSVTISLVYLAVSVLLAHLAMSWFKVSLQNAIIKPILCFTFVAATLLDFIPVFLFVQLCILLMSILLYLDRGNEVSLISAIFLGAFFPVIGTTTDIVDLLGLDYIFLATLAGLGCISILLVFVIIHQGNYLATQSKDVSRNKITVPLWKRIASPVLPINLDTTLLFTSLIIILVIIANLMYDIIIGTILFWMLLSGMAFNIEIVKVTHMRTPPSRNKILLVTGALICIDLLISYLISVILGLIDISILFPVLLALVFLAVLNAMYLPSLQARIREKRDSNPHESLTWRDP